MPINVTMPRLSDTMERGTVVKWNVKEGDEVAVGDVLADIETDKATMELEAFDAGKVAKLAVGEGDSVAVGETILVIAEEGESVEDAAASMPAGAGAGKETAAAGGGGEPAGSTIGGAPATTAEQKGGGQPSSGLDAPPAPPAERAGTEGNGRAPAPARGGEGGRVFASPLARKLAEEKGVDLGSIQGSGPSQRIVRRDVEAAISGGAAPSAERGERPSTGREAAPAPAPMEAPRLEAKTVELSNMRGTIARRLVESKQSIPHYQVSVDIDMDRLVELRRQLNEQLESQGVKLSVNDFLVRATALAMHQHPFVNSRWVDKGGQPKIEVIGEVNIGVAIALPMERGGGLVVGVLRQADRMGLRQISSETRRLAKKAREKGLTLEEMQGGTFTISNLGMYGVSHFTAIINPPEVAILAVGAAEQRPVVRDGEIVVGNVMTMTMSSDHRIVDGAMAAEYLGTVREMLENPATLLV